MLLPHFIMVTFYFYFVSTRCNAFMRYIKECFQNKMYACHRLIIIIFIIINHLCEYGTTANLSSLHQWPACDVMFGAHIYFVIFACLYFVTGDALDLHPE